MASTSNPPKWVECSQKCFVPLATSYCQLAMSNWPHRVSISWEKRSINAVALLKRLMGSHMPLNVLSCRGRAVPVQDMLSKCWSYLKLYHEVTGFRHKKSCRSRRNKRIINRTQQELPKIWPWSMTAHPCLGLLICGWLWTCGCLQKDNKKRAFLKKGTSTVYRCLIVYSLYHTIQCPPDTDLDRSGFWAHRLVLRGGEFSWMTCDNWVDPKHGGKIW